MPSTRRMSEQDNKLDRQVNAFATQSFRDQADRDYIAARLACRYELFPQFLWAAQQAIEKYLKAILLYSRVKAVDVGHNLTKALALVDSLPLQVELSLESRTFIAHLARVGEFRYIDVPFHIEGCALVDLDRAVWEIRRYCQVLDVGEKVLPFQEQELLDAARSDVVKSKTEPVHKFRLQNGLLESIVDNKKHPSRPALLWNNLFFGVRKRASIRVKSHLSGQNPILYIYPEMLDELLKYVYIPKTLRKLYRKRQEDMQDRIKGKP